MPIYDYECANCGTISEILVRSNLSAKIKCPRCGGEQMDRLLTASYAIRMNGMSSTTATCCGRDERCDNPPCGSGGGCCGG